MNFLREFKAVILLLLLEWTTDVFANTNEKEGSWKLLGSTKEILLEQ